MSQIDDLGAAVNAALLEANKSVAHAVAVMQAATASLSTIANVPPAGPDPAIQAVIDLVNSSVDPLAKQLDGAAVALAAAMPPPAA